MTDPMDFPAHATLESLIMYVRSACDTIKPIQFLTDDDFSLPTNHLPPSRATTFREPFFLDALRSIPPLELHLLSARCLCANCMPNYHWVEVGWMAC
jgi:hypothetical protein